MVVETSEVLVARLRKIGCIDPGRHRTCGLSIETLQSDAVVRVADNRTRENANHEWTCILIVSMITTMEDKPL